MCCSRIGRITKLCAPTVPKAALEALTGEQVVAEVFDLRKVEAAAENALGLETGLP